MVMVNVDRILNESPKKRLIIGYDKLKSNFTESQASDFFAIYKDQPLSFILENSRMIFSEPYYGRNFYKDIFEFAHVCPILFDKYGEVNKVKDYMEEFSSRMSETQKKEYSELLSFMESTMESVKGLTFIESVGSDKEYEKIVSLSDAIYKSDLETANNVFNTLESAFSVFAFAPNVYGLNRDASYIRESFSRYVPDTDEYLDESNFSRFIENTIICNKLFSDKYFVENTVTKLPRPIRLIYNGYASENVVEHVQELFTVRVNEFPTNKYFNGSSFVNDVFEDYNFEFVTTECADNKVRNNELAGILYSQLFDIVHKEYTECDDTSMQITGYPFFENMTIEQALETVALEAERYDRGKPSKVVAQHSTSMREEKDKSKKSKAPSQEDDDFDDEPYTSKKSVQKNNLEKPESKDLATRIQNKAMDIEAKQLEKMAKREEKGQKIKGAVKAITNVPANVLNKFKENIDEWDTADEDRRKKYMIEPGYRKKLFRNLKLAITYGAASQVNLLLVPAVAIVRHYSKQKDRRIRNELFRELETEIKICDEKIADANASNDQKQKYQLMRIKSKLENEMVRVKLNSKYI